MEPLKQFRDFLEIAFLHQKLTAKLLIDAFYAMIYCLIKKFPWSDPGRLTIGTVPQNQNSVIQWL